MNFLSACFSHERLCRGHVARGTFLAQKGSFFGSFDK